MTTPFPIILDKRDLQALTTLCWKQGCTVQHYIRGVLQAAVWQDLSLQAEIKGVRGDHWGQAFTVAPRGRPKKDV